MLFMLQIIKTLNHLSALGYFCAELHSINSIYLQTLTQNREIPWIILSGQILKKYT